MESFKLSLHVKVVTKGLNGGIITKEKVIESLKILRLKEKYTSRHIA